MKVKLYYVETNGYCFVMSDNGESRRVLTDDKEPMMTAEWLSPAEFLNRVADDSSWEAYEETAEELIGDGEVIAEIEKIL